MSSYLCPDCGELIEDGAVHLDGTPILPGDALLLGKPIARLCPNCRPPVSAPRKEDGPCPKGTYADLYRWRDEKRWRDM